MSGFILALDQGTTSSRAVVFGQDGLPVSMAQRETRQILPSPGHVEHDPEDIWQTQIETAKEAVSSSMLDIDQIASIGITNQRETTLLWEKSSGKPIHNAVVWQSRISADICERLRKQGHESIVRERTGLVLDPYFSATKLMWLFEQDSSLREAARRGDLLFGTVDSYLIWRLTGGTRHVTDISNASRTMLFNLHQLEWDEELLKLFDIPAAVLPEVVPCSGLIGETDEKIFGRTIPITGCAGDQQAATFGQACFNPGEAKNTYGTGCFLVMNIGDQPKLSDHRLVTCVGWKIGDEVTYCLEGSVFVAGALVQWLRDQLGIIESSSEIQALASQVDSSDGVVIVPAFTGLGAPHWDASARGTMFGLTRGTSKAHLARAALEAIALQIDELVQAMTNDSGQELAQLKVDGGASVDNLLMQIQSDIIGCTLQRPQVPETTALGAAYLAGLESGVWQGLDEVTNRWKLDQAFEPQQSDAWRTSLRKRWNQAIERTLNWES